MHMGQPPPIGFFPDGMGQGAGEGGQMPPTGNVGKRPPKKGSHSVFM